MICELEYVTGLSEIANKESAQVPALVPGVASNGRPGIEASSKSEAVRNEKG